jgi:hypothetical protein
MTIVPCLSSFLITEPLTWGANWAWGLPLISLTVLIHVLCLGVVRQWASRAATYSILRRHQNAMFGAIICGVTLSATALHGIEAGLWAVAYRFLDALPDTRTAMLYSLNALTSYGHVTLQLDPRWDLMGAMEALNGWLLFGLSTAFLFAIIDKLLRFDNDEEMAGGAVRS